MGNSVWMTMVMALAASHALAEGPLERGSFNEHVSGPVVEHGSLDGKVVLLEYFGFH